MLKSIFLIALSFSLTLSTAANAAVSPLPLLVEQCLQLRAPIENIQGHKLIAADENIDNNTQLINDAFALETSLLSLFNIKDRLNYYKSFSLPHFYQESVLQCQLHLADLMSDTLNSPWVTRFIDSLKQQQAKLEPELIQLTARLVTLKAEQLNLTDKSKLHTAQATVKQGLRTQELTLQFTEADCQLPIETRQQPVNSDNAKTHPNKTFNQSIATYLIRQKDPGCQKLVWQAYQGRAKKKNEHALNRIYQLRHNQARLAQFQDHTHLVLNKQYLSTPELVKTFLDSQTSLAPTPPWQLGNKLAQSKRSVTDILSSASLLSHIQGRAETLGFRFEIITDDIHRVWYRERLLGDIFVSSATRTKTHTLRVPVLGRQYGQIQFLVKANYKNISDKTRFISEYASALSSLSSSSHYYLLNTLSETQDTSAIGQLWLNMYLSEGIISPVEINSRESTMSLFSKQLKIFRSKVALNFYSATNKQAYVSLEDEFTHSFSLLWDKSEDYPYNFYAIVTSGPLYYQQMWQESLAEYIYLATKHCKNQHDVYKSLLVNEGFKPFELRLSALIGDPVDPLSLIKRIKDGFSFSEIVYQDQYDLTCTI
ncbi:hypothetical protein FM038_010995 [Shewanella eurypsychrophilus]|uniref:Zn-dependent oligopeptidase n=2 Tax=Shewanella eurypsychrophilus TaxID=2593656 RepID=A0ABX6V7F4_9GAMM|nr:M3 family metallopeptidase [Shewanella sp. YLB-09]QFU22635.1 hypothetical protein FS418_12575 [Shewanella sp. YLB-09]QPG57924.1 hypothetical protein FM038_010995 [Shewanella eurypsychrophilus]